MKSQNNSVNKEQPMQGIPGNFTLDMARSFTEKRISKKTLRTRLRSSGSRRASGQTSQCGQFHSSSGLLVARLLQGN